MMRSIFVGMAMLSILPCAAAAQPAQVTVQLWSFGFAPNPIHLAAGRPVTLIFANRSGVSHDFTAPGFFRHASVTSGAVTGDEVELRGHETKTVTLVPSAGTYHAHCSHFLHKQMGMNALIVVD